MLYEIKSEWWDELQHLKLILENTSFVLKKSLIDSYEDKMEAYPTR